MIIKIDEVKYIYIIYILHDLFYYLKKYNFIIIYNLTTPAKECPLHGNKQNMTIILYKYIK